MHEKADRIHRTGGRQIPAKHKEILPPQRVDSKLAY